MCCGSVVSCDPTPGSTCADAPRVFPRGRSHVGPRSNCSWPPRCRNICSCCGLESVRGQVRMPSFWMRRRLLIGSKSTARMTTRVVLVVLLLNFLFLSYAFANSTIFRRCRFRVGSLRFVLTVLMMLFGHHRFHKVGMLHMCSIRCCCSSFLVFR